MIHCRRVLFAPSFFVLRSSSGIRSPIGAAVGSNHHLFSHNLSTQPFFHQTKNSIRTIMSTSYQAWRVEEKADGTFRGSEQTLSINDLPGSDDNNKTVLIKVSHSSLNYKDALSAAGNKGVTRHYPHTPGIDAAGVTVETGQPVLVTGYGLGMSTNGGFGEYIRVPADWIVPLPYSNPRTAMVYGTAGLTAGLCVMKLLQMGATPAQGQVIVTGASGAVGSVAVELLTKLGFEVVAVSGKADNHLKELGAVQVLGREALESSKKPLLQPVYGNAIDTVGGAPLAELLKQIKPGGSVACCGLVAGMQLETTVLPFILRGIHLLGVDSVEIPLPEKQHVWNNLAGPWACPKTESMARDIGRHELDACLKAFLKGQSSGKIVLDHSITAANSSL